MPVTALVRSALFSAAILIVGLAVVAHGQSIMIQALEEQLARIDRHDQAKMEATAATAMLRRVNDAPSEQR